MTIDLDALRAPFRPDQISWRVGATTGDKARGMALAYIDARAVMDRLDDVCGPAGWQRRYSHAAEKTICEIGIRIDDEWIWKADGAGDTAHEAEKGALSDAFKRAAVCWGIGRYLYEIASPWVTIEPAGKSYKIADSETAKLARLVTAPAAPLPKPQHGPTKAAFLIDTRARIDACKTRAEIAAIIEAPEFLAQMDELNLSETERSVITGLANQRMAEIRTSPAYGRRAPVSRLNGHATN